MTSRQVALTCGLGYTEVVCTQDQERSRLSFSGNKPKDKTGLAFHVFSPGGGRIIAITLVLQNVLF